MNFPRRKSCGNCLGVMQTMLTKFGNTKIHVHAIHEVIFFEFYESVSNSTKQPMIWSNYSDLTRSHPKR